ncbi:MULTISPECIES: GAF domain-containing protein [Aerosakkonema]|uniref:sensor histidine kinase n=1 Tax=Aerosakkonema TaxID=1246629 RepID=UPI0035B8E08D
MKETIKQLAKPTFPESIAKTMPSWPNLLQGVAEATRQLLTAEDYATAINEALATLGRVTGVDRVYIFEIHPHPETGEPVTSQRFEWAHTSVTAELNNPILQNLDFAAYEMTQWYETLKAGNSVSALIKELPSIQRQLIEPQGALSILVVPIPINGQLWGVIGFDDCHCDRRWSRDEEAVLMTMAATLGGVIAQRQTQEELRQERDFIAAILDTAGALVVVLDRQGQIIRFNRACEQTTDYSFDEVKGKHFWDLFLIREEKEAVKVIFSKLKAGHFPINYENYWLTKNGIRRRIAWSSTAIFDANRNVKYIIGTGIDITERYLAQEELRKGEELYRTLARNFPNGGVFLFDRNLRYSIAEGTGLAAIGVSKELLEGQTIWEVWSPETCKIIEPYYRAALAGNTNIFELQYGESVYLLHTLPVKNERGEIFAGMLMSLDITERKRVEIALRESERRLRQQNRVLMELAKDKTINSGNLKTAIQKITEAAAKTLEIERASVWLYNSDRSRITCIDLYERSLNRHSQGLELAAVNYPAYFKALETERTIAAADAYSDPRTRDFSERYLTPIGVKSMLDSPIWLGGQMVGIVCQEQVETCRHWALEEENFAGSIADLVSLAIEAYEHQKAEEQLLAAVQRDRLLAQIALRIRRSLNLDEILNTTVAEVRQFLQADRVFIGYQQLNSQGQIVAESVDSKYPSVLGFLVNDKSYLQELRSLFENHRVRVVEDTAKATQQPCAKYYSQYKIRAGLGVPILLGDQLFGALVVHQCSAPRHWQEFEIGLLEQLATQVAIAIQQAELYQQVYALNANLERQVEERTSQLQQRNRELQEINQLKDIFLHAVTHDLRTPVMGWLLVLKNLLNTHKSAFINNPKSEIPVPRSTLERMIESSDRQLHLINSLLEVHSTEVRGLALYPKPLQLNEIVQAIIADLEPLLDKNKAKFHNLISSDMPMINADREQLWRVFENLVTNALNHNPPGLNLTLKATVENGKTPECKHDNTSDLSLGTKHLGDDYSVLLKAQFLRFTLEDNGVGMDRETCEHLFELYVRGSHVRRLTGIGLGLYLCRQIITAHGGEIGVISSPGAGATFWFTLPVVSIGV